MCNFFSLTSDGLGNIKYFNWEQRKKILNKEDGYKGYNPDSHTSINDFYGFKGADKDIRNKYEYNPLTKVLKVDQINSIDDSEIVKEKVRDLDFKEIIEPLVVKPIIHPFRDIPKVEKAEEKHLELLREWGSVRAPVRDSVWASVFVGASVLDSVRDSVRDSVLDFVRDSVLDFVRDSVWDFVRYSVEASVWASVWDFLYAYISSFFTIEKWKYIDHEPFTNPFQPAIDLWEMGIVPIFDGIIWSLRSGKNADVIWEGKVQRI